MNVNFGAVLTNALTRAIPRDPAFAVHHFTRFLVTNTLASELEIHNELKISPDVSIEWTPLCTQFGGPLHLAEYGEESGKSATRAHRDHRRLRALKSA